jgi:predicted patatin/cPLA2 family phospholipase
MEENKSDPRKVYSELGKIPLGEANDSITDGVLVLQGGSFRGLYTAGVLDVLSENGINFNVVVGVSAGCLSGINYVSGQSGRYAYMNLKYRHDSEFVGVRAMMKDSGLVGFQEMLYGDASLEIPLDEKRLMDPKRKMYAVITALDDGEPYYQDIGKSANFIEAMHFAQASGSVPIVSQPVRIRNRYYLDGGCADKIPIEWALNRFEDKKIVVVKTVDKSFRKGNMSISEKKALEIGFSRYPAFANRVIKGNQSYNRKLDLLDKLEEEKRIYLFQPEEPVDFQMFEGDMQKLAALYWSARKQTEKELPALKEYLARK